MEVELEQLVGKRFERAPKTWTLWICATGYQGQDAGRKRRGVEKDAGDAGTDAGEILWILMDVQLFQTVFVWYFSTSVPPNFPAIPVSYIPISGSVFPNCICILG